MDISVQNLVKHYQVHKRTSGVLAAVKSLFRRRYEAVKAVDNISFHIKRGERVGFLGPNGAGKTTTLKMLSGLLVPTAGTITIDSHRPIDRRYAFLKSIMLVTGQKNQLLWDLPPSDTFELNRAIYDVPQAIFDTRLDELVTLLQIQDVIRKPTRQLSLGERMKCELAAALLHAPKLLFLDEPTIGLDVTMQALVRQFIKAYNQKYGATVILTSHNMDDVAALCERIILINHGQIFFDGSLAELVHQTRPDKRIVVTFHGTMDQGLLPTATKILENGSQKMTLQVAENDLQATIKLFLQYTTIQDLTVENAALEDVLADAFANAPITT